MLRRMSEKNMRRLAAGLVGVGAGVLPLIDSVAPLPDIVRAVWLVISVLLLAAASVYLFLSRRRGKGHAALGAAAGLNAAVFFLTLLPVVSQTSPESLTLCLFLNWFAMYVSFWVSCILPCRRASLFERVLLIAAAVFFAYGFGYAADSGLTLVTALGFLCRAGALTIDS